MRKTGVDALAIAIGTSHGAYKFSREPTGDILAIDRVRAIHTRLPNTHLVMHGSSSVPQEWLAIIREYGGELNETYGVPVDEIKEAIRNGVSTISGGLIALDIEHVRRAVVAAGDGALRIAHRGAEQQPRREHLVGSHRLRRRWRDRPAPHREQTAGACR